MTSAPCRARHGVGRCGGVVESVVLLSGQVRSHCARCVRFRAGICRDCPGRVDGTVGKAKRCRACRRRAMADAQRTYRRRHLEEVRARDRAWRQSPAQREHKRAYDRAYRRRYPLKEALAKRRQMARTWHGYKSREAYVAHYREYYRRNRARCLAYNAEYQRRNKEQINARRRALAQKKRAQLDAAA